MADFQEQIIKLEKEFVSLKAVLTERWANHDKTSKERWDYQNKQSHDQWEYIKRKIDTLCANTSGLKESFLMQPGKCRDVLRRDIYKIFGLILGIPASLAALLVMLAKIIG